MRHFVGIDISSFDMKVCILDTNGDKLKAFTVDNKLKGTEYLRDLNAKVYNINPKYWKTC
ncbi:hypothetical protein [Alkaliphilus sp. B6464]|uniref:hypothetical protein n=1 Tax=Alkaliphilus sp. B6464 TaxID=2731219 RepID=UPI001BA60C1A|nr:hypothetical protein [Alkaliphilus sp. B6464]QUH19472.1 hypothetical protein HYG84_05940 [Alkaliphilus sp. B6464]